MAADLIVDVLAGLRVRYPSTDGRANG